MKRIQPLRTKKSLSEKTDQEKKILKDFSILEQVSQYSLANLKPLPWVNHVTASSSLKDKIKFHNEAHKENYEKVMKARSEFKRPIDSKMMIEQILL